MQLSVIQIRVLCVATIVLVVVIGWWFGTRTDTKDSQYLQVTFFDVGQGDAIFIETPDGVQVLIDGGRDSTVLRELSRELSWFDRSLDLVVATHPDLDHIGGLLDVLARYQVAQILTTENAGESSAAAEFLRLQQAEDAVITYARSGQVIQLGASTTMTVYSPASNPAVFESNASSIVVQVRYGGTEFMLTGDAPQGIETYLVEQYGEALESEVLKLGHHGSDTSTAAAFLATVSPEYAVVSAGKDNSYGHPHPDVLSRVAATDAVLSSTAEQGSITFYSDGAEVWRAN